MRHIIMFWLAAALNSASAQPLTIYTEDWPPASFIENDKVSGMVVEMVQALQARIGSREPIQLVPWMRGYKALLEEPNIMLFTLGRSAEREKLMIMLGPVAISNTALYTRKGHAARLLAMGDRLYQQPVGAYRGSVFADAAKKKGFMRFDLAPTPQMTANKLLARRFDLWVEGSIAVPSVLKKIGHSSNEIEKVMILESLELYLAFSTQTSARTIKEWEDALIWLKKDGQFQKIHHKWQPNEAPPMDVAVLRPPH